MKTTDLKTYAMNPKDPGQQPKKALTIKPSGEATEAVDYISYPAHRGEVDSLCCDRQWMKATPAWNPTARDRVSAILKLAETTEDFPSYRTISPTISYLRLPSFSMQNVERLRRLLPSLPASAGHEKLLIVDLRGNEGGGAPIEALARWVDLAQLRRVVTINRRLRISCLYTAFRWGYTQFTMSRMQPPISEELRGDLQHTIDKLFEPTPPGCPDSIEETRSAWSYSRHRFTRERSPGRPRLLILVDNACCSDAEYMAYCLAATPGAVVAGTNTFGVAQFIQPGYTILPHTKLRFRIALGTSDQYGDNRSFDGYGLNVDVLLSTEDTQSPGVILKLAKWLESQ
jgi:C-terminal processing protease CtpA/Prc